MADKIDFSGVGRYKRRDADGQTYTPADQITFAEPLWLCEDGVIIPLSQINDRHLQHIERWLRKGGATLPPQLLIDTWKDIIRAELDKRRLALLPDHPNRPKVESSLKFGEFPRQGGRTVEDKIWDLIRTYNGKGRYDAE